MANSTLRVTITRDYQEDIASLLNGVVIDLPEPLARRLAVAGYCDITPNATGATPLVPGDGSGGTATPDATASVKGKLQLAGALSGTADAPTALGYADAAALATAMGAKQATLVSGSNLKTINGSSVLGSGDLVIAGGGGGSSEAESVSSTYSGFAVPSLGASANSFTNIACATTITGTGTSRSSNVLGGAAGYYVPRVGCVAATSTANSVAGFAQSTGVTVGVAPGADPRTPPVVARVRQVPSDAIASACRTAMGIAKLNPALDTIEPSAHTECIMLAADAVCTQTGVQGGATVVQDQLVVMCNDSTGACDQYVLAGDWPANSNSINDYDFYVKFTGGAGTDRKAVWVATNHRTGLTQTGTITSNLPSTVGSTKLSAFALRSCAANTGVAPALDGVGMWFGGFAEAPGAGVGGFDQATADALYDPAPVAAETVGRALAAADDRQQIAVDAATTQNFTLAVGVAITRGVSFEQEGTGSLTLTVPAGVTINGVDGSVQATYTLTQQQWTGATLRRRAAVDAYTLI